MLACQREGEEIWFDAPWDYDDALFLEHVYYLNEEVLTWAGNTFFMTLLTSELEERYELVSFDEEPRGLVNGVWEFFPKAGSVAGLRYDSYIEGYDQAAFDAKVEEVLSQMPDGTASDEEKIRALAEYLCANIVYDSQYCYGTPYEALMEGRTVCGGYASAFAYLARRMGLRCFNVIGYAVWSGGGTGGTFAKRMGNGTTLMSPGWISFRGEFCGIGLWFLMRTSSGATFTTRIWKWGFLPCGGASDRKLIFRERLLSDIFLNEKQRRSCIQ